MNNLFSARPCFVITLKNKCQGSLEFVIYFYLLKIRQQLLK